SNMHSRQVFSTVVYSISCATAMACSGSHTQDRQTKARPEFRVALLTPGPISDQSWNSGAYNGLLLIRYSLAAKISHVQTRTPAEFEENFRHYGAEGYALVFGHGFEFQDAARRVAPSYPKTVYVTTSGDAVGPNLAGMEFNFA